MTSILGGHFFDAVSRRANIVNLGTVKTALKLVALLYPHPNEYLTALRIKKSEYYVSKSNG
jgi:hypothetical protein